MQPGGVCRYVSGLTGAAALRHYRHQIVCLTSCNGVMAASWRAVGVEVSIVPHRWPDPAGRWPYRMWGATATALRRVFVRRLATYLQRQGVGIVHSHVVTALDLQAEAVLVHAGLPWVLTFHGSKSIGECERRGCRRVTAHARASSLAVTAVSEAVRREVDAMALVPLGTVLVTPGGVDVTSFRGPQRSPSLLRAELGIPAGGVLFGAAGMLGPVKGHDILVAAAKLLVRRGADIYVAIAGEGDGRAQLEGLIARAGIGKRIHLLGLVADMKAFLCAVDAFVMPSRSEGLPLALLEALAAGLPCVASRVGGIPEVLAPGGGIMVEPGSPVALAEAMGHMLDSSRRRKIAEQSCLAAQRYDLRATTSAVADVYDNLMPARYNAHDISAV